jgi:uncharacterized membrane-anchored protein YitT (DUF2179 family)
LFIISDKYQEIAIKYSTILTVEVLLLKVVGCTTTMRRKIIFVNVSRRELSILTEYVNEIDPKAFLTVIEASEILGEGFKSLDDKVGDDALPTQQLFFVC